MVRKEKLGLFGVRKTFELAIDALYVAHGESEDSSAWHSIERLVLELGPHGWEKFWNTQEAKYPGISSTIQRYNPSKPPIIAFIEAYRLDVGPEGDTLDLQVVSGVPMAVSEDILKGLQTVIDAFTEKIDQQRPKVFGFL